MTKSLIEQNINPGKIKVGVSNIKYIKDGGVAISCEKKEDLISVSENIQKQLGAEYEVTIPEKKCPKIKIINVEEKLIRNEKDFIENIVLQNTVTTPDSEKKISVIKHYKGKLGKESVILEVDAKTYSILQKKEKLSIGWKSYRFFDHVNVIQCFKCYRLGHLAKECKSEVKVCPKCTEDHTADECQSQQVICTNCKYASLVLKVPNVDYNHTAYDKNCAAYRRIYRKLQQKINYPSIYQK